MREQSFLRVNGYHTRASVMLYRGRKCLRSRNGHNLDIESDCVRQEIDPSLQRLMNRAIGSIQESLKLLNDPAVNRQIVVIKFFEQLKHNEQKWVMSRIAQRIAIIGFHAHVYFTDSPGQG